MTRTYAIGDVHGQLALLREVHDRIAADRVLTGDDGAPVVHLGDYVDRGPDVCGTLEFLSDGLARGEPWVLLRGNHDRIMSLFLEDPPQEDPLRPDLDWLESNMGGRRSLESYGVDSRPGRPVADIHRNALAAVPASHVALLKGLKNSHRRGAAFYCHAGVRPGVALEAQAEDDLVWIRREFLLDTRDYGALIVHGHTPVDRISHHGNRLNLDTGAAYGGPLSVVVIEDGEVNELTATGRRPVLPFV